MSTHTVPFHFVVVGATNKSTWTHQHAIPSSLLLPTGPNPTPAYQQRFRSTMLAAMRQYQDECTTRAADTCVACSQPSKTATLSPCSYLHRPADPFINILVHPVCGDPGCAQKANEMVKELMAEMQVEDAGAESGAGGKRCAGCGKGEAEGLQRCARCKVVVYCGRECQKRDFKKHKAACAETVEKNKDLPGAQT